MPTLAIQLATLSHAAVIELFVLDATALGGGILRFHNGTNELRGPVIWQGNEYSHWPIEASGFATSGSGPIPRPTLRVSNVGGLVGVLVRQYKGLRGALLTRKRMPATALDAVNFAGGVNPAADPDMHFADEVWMLDRQAQRDKRVVIFELASPMDVAGTQLPRRQIMGGHCTWLQDGGYRGPQCGYTGPAVARADDTPTSLMLEDACGGRLSSCRLRVWPADELPIGAFPGVGVLRSV